ncbi:MAG TPA: hypothetical protein VJU15_13975, partial [Gemmatimonadales bacterium]|nr:hypothetical protein [Gemmatimonadales bacterium]
MMFLTSRAMVLLLILTTMPQAGRTALDRCAIGEQPAARYQLPAHLNEVSGLAVGGRGTLLTHGDEAGVIDVLEGSTLKLSRAIHLQGIPRDDFEGIAAAGDSVALMTSTG